MALDSCFRPLSNHVKSCKVWFAFSWFSKPLSFSVDNGFPASLGLFPATEAAQGRSNGALLGLLYWWGKLNGGEEAPVVVGGGRWRLNLEKPWEGER